MIKKQIVIDYEEYSSYEEMNQSDREVVKASIEAIQGSYAPYSQFHVGAAVLLDDGTIVRGANQENAAYPSGLCAERTAMFAASAQHPDVPMACIAIAGSQDGRLCADPVPPCGACRQVMAQYQLKAGHDMAVILVGSERIWKFARVDDVLPFIFDNV